MNSFSNLFIYWTQLWKGGWSKSLVGNSTEKHALLVITKLVNQSVTIFEPMIQWPKGRPPNTKKKTVITSMTRDHSRF